MLSRRQLLAGLAGIPAARALPWQEEAQFSTGVSVVNVLTVVRDRDGKVVKDLTVDDFTLEEDGRPIPIRYFSRQSDLPLVLGLLVDSSGSVRSVLGDEIKAARQFFRQVIREDQDRAFVIHFANEIELLQDLTPSVARLEAALEDLEGGSRPQLKRFLPRQFQFPGQRIPRFPIPGPVPGRIPSPNPAPRPAPSGGSRGGTCLHDAVFLGADEILRPEAGRKAMILISDGLDRGSKVSLSTAIEMAQRADAIAYSIRFSGSGRDDGEGKAALDRISSETGGVLFEASGKQRLEQIFASIEEELRNQYNLGFAADPVGTGYRKLRVTVNRPRHTVRARDGYYAGL